MFTLLLAAMTAYQPLPGGVTCAGSRDGADTFAYSLAPHAPHMNGNLPRLGRTVEILFAEPRDVSGAERIAFEAHGLYPDDRHRDWSVDVRPIIEDVEGERFYLVPRLVKPIARPSAGSWCRYETGNWYSGEAGAASHGLYVVGGRSGDARPTGALRFLGWQLHVAREAPSGRADEPGYAAKLAAAQEPVRGVIAIAAVEPAGEKVPFRYPFLFADNVCVSNGTYRFAASVTKDFQAEPVGGVVETFAYAQGDRRLLEIPTGPDGIYWIRWALSDANGAELGAGAFRTQTLGNPANELPPVVQMPEQLRVVHAGQGVYERGAPFEMRVAGMRGERTTFTLEPYCARETLREGEVPSDGRLAFPRVSGIDVFRLRLMRWHGASVAETAEFLFGERTDPQTTHARPGRLIGRDELKAHPYNRLSYTVMHRNKGKYPLKWYENDFVRFIRETRAWIQNLTVHVDLADFEVLEGVYDFTLTDRLLDIAADWGVKLTLKADHADWWAGQYRWNKYSSQFSFDNTVCGPDNPCGVFAATDAEMKRFYVDACRAFYGRYREHVAFQGYYVCQPASEFTVVDQPWIGSISGYSPEEQRGFRAWLRAKYGTLVALNAKWGRAFAAWEEVRAPRPAFKLGARPDLRPEWTDFSRWKENLADAWYVDLLTGIRQFDTNRVTIAYGEPNLKYRGLLDFCHNGGNARMDLRGEFVDEWEKGGIGWITEPIHPHYWAADHVPGAGGWTLDASVWSMLCQAGAGGANLHLYSFTDPGEKFHIGNVCAQDRMRRYLTVLEEIHDTRIIRPENEIATYAGMDTLLLKHRAYFPHRLADLRRWLELVEADKLKASRLERFPGRTFKLIVPNVLDEVIPAAVYSNVVSQVRDGGAVCLMTVRTGRFVTEFGEGVEFPLLKAFDIPLPKGNWRTTGDYRAVALAGNPLFDEGAAFDIQTLDRLRRETHEPNILSDFGKYPYRWIPETDYFGCYDGMELLDGPEARTIATFANGKTAMSLHRAGRGKVILFWGLPSQTNGALAGLMARAAAFAGVKPSLADVGDWFEMHGDASGRHYGFFYLETTGESRRLVFPHCPDGRFFADDMVADRKYGLYSGCYLREHGIDAKWTRGESPLKAIRLIPSRGESWMSAYEVKE